MNPAPNIVDLVKQLQATHPPNTFLHAKMGSASELAEVRVTGQFAEHLAKLHNAFPTLASALLEREEKLRIAVEALVKIAGTSSDHSTYESAVADAALSRLRQPTPSDS